jgi:hypothetical protein
MALIQKSWLNWAVSTASTEAGVFRLEATGIVIKGWRQKRYQPYAVWRRPGARVALLRCPIGHDDANIILKPAGGLKR